MRLPLCLVLCLLSTLATLAQEVQGRVVAREGGDPLPGVYVYYDGATSQAVQTDDEGHYRIAFRRGTLVFSMMGFQPQREKVTRARQLNIELREAVESLQEVKVTGRKKKYSRRDNPAVEMMRRVMAAKGAGDLRRNPYLSLRKYNKLTFSLNDVTDRVFQDGEFKRLPFLKDHVEVHPHTGRLVLPIVVSERVERTLYRREPRAECSIVEAERSEGLNDLFNTGGIVNSLLDDCITEVDFYQRHVRLLQYPFISPLANEEAIQFYRYFITDTLLVGSDRCFRLQFSPNNLQDFGFSGALYVRADSTWRLRRAEVGIPSRSDVNFVEKMEIIQDFDSLSTGEQVVTDNRMIIQFKLVEGAQKVMAELATHVSDISFEPIADKHFESKAPATHPQAQLRPQEYWQEARPEPLSRSEQRMGQFLDNLYGVRGFKPFIWIVRAFIENYVETTLKPEWPNLVDIGPVNTVLGSNWVEGFHLRASAQTTAHLHPHLFARGYVKYGFGDRRWKGMGELTYSLLPKAYHPSEFPVHNISAQYTRDLAAPSDKYMSTDKDNVFVSLKWTPVHHMTYVERWSLHYDREWRSGLRMGLQLRREGSTPAGELRYQPLAGTDPLAQLITTEVTLSLQYRPGANYVNTKQRRLVTNLDAPNLSLTHTTGFKGVLGGQYNYNFTEASAFKRFWLGAWGRVDVLARGGVQWNRVPFPLLIMPAANLSYIIDNRSFRLVSNMEFPSDSYASAILLWDLNGRILNRIPLVNRLKWRGFIGCNVLWSQLSDANNPLLPQNAASSHLFVFPTETAADGSTRYISRAMNPHEPYAEVLIGVRNIFKFGRVEYVRRLNYLSPSTQRWGVRCALEFSF